MKNPLHYQLSEYDCGPTSLLNGISYLLSGRKFRRRSSAISCSIVWTAMGRKARRGKRHLLHRHDVFEQLARRLRPTDSCPFPVST